MKTFFPRIWAQQQEEAKHAEHEHTDDHKKHGCGICPVMAILIIIQVYHLYNLYCIKDCYTQIRFFKKAKEAVATRNVTDVEERSVAPTERTLLDQSDEIEALAPESDL